MADERTVEQRQADEALAAAIDRVTRVYSALEPATVITGWVVVGTGLAADGSGDLYPDFVLLPDNGRGMSHVQIIGMLRAASLRVEASYVSPD